MPKFRPLLFTGIIAAICCLLALTAYRAYSFQFTKIARVSVGENAAPANGDSSAPFINADGEYLAFVSKADNLAPGHKTGHADVYFYDRQQEKTILLSKASDGKPADGSSSDPSISMDGLRIVFSSDASNLAPDDTNKASDIFLYDRWLKRLDLVSIGVGGKPANGASTHPQICASDGSCVVFTSAAANLVAGDTNGKQDIFIRNLQPGTTERISMGLNDAQPNGDSYAATLSFDGQFVAFTSDAGNLVPGDTNGCTDVFVYDRQTKKTERVNITTDGKQADGRTLPTAVAISGDGRYVAYLSEANNLASGDTHGFAQLYVYDRTARTTTRVSVSPDGAPANAAVTEFALSLDGKVAAFTTSAGNLVAGDKNNAPDIFLRDLEKKATTRISVAADGAEAVGGSAGAVSLNGNGRFAAFASAAGNLAPGGNTNTCDIFIFDRTPEVDPEWPPPSGPFVPGATGEKQPGAAPTQAEIDAAKKAGTRQATIHTAKGDIVLALAGADAPLTVANFVKLAQAHFYDGLTFHRVETAPEFSLIQGGDPEGNGTGGPGYGINLEISPKLKHDAGAVGMARSAEPDSAGSQFYIVTVPIHALDGQYAVFAKVTQGLDVVKKIKVGDKILSVVVK